MHLCGKKMMIRTDKLLTGYLYTRRREYDNVEIKIVITREDVF